MEHAAKWSAYYEKNFTPWDSHQACSQLVAAFTLKVNCTLPSESQQLEGDGSIDNHLVQLAHREAPVSSPLVEERGCTLIEELEEKLAGLQKQEVSSQIEGVDLDMTTVFVEMLRATYSHYKSRRGVGLDEAMEQFRNRKEQGVKDFTAMMKLRQMHESVQSMYLEKIEGELERAETRLSSELHELIQRDAMMLQAELDELKRMDSQNIEKEICPIFQVGDHVSPARWTCLELGCGTGASSVWMASQGCNVVGIDLIHMPLREASAKAIMAGVVSRCVFIMGDVFELSGRGFSFLQASLCLSKYLGGDDQGTSKGFPSVKHVMSVAAEDMNTKSTGLDYFNSGEFDFVFDCQCFHVIREMEDKAVGVVRAVLRPGGLYMVLTGNDAEPEAGPAVLSKSQLAKPFRLGFDQEAIIQTRFDRTLEYDKLKKSPLAWCAIFRKRLELDASKWQSTLDCWTALLAGLRSSPAHRPGFDRLAESLIRDENGIKRPVTIGVMNVSGRSGAVISWVNALKEVLEQMDRDGSFSDGRVVRVLVI